MNWKLYIDSLEKIALDFCDGSMDKGGGWGNGCGNGYDDGDGDGWGSGWSSFGYGRSDGWGSGWGSYGRTGNGDGTSASEWT
jgi:hypothetical protein